VHRAPQHGDACSVVALDRGRLVFIEPTNGASTLPAFAPPSLPFIAGQALRANDIAVTREVLSRNAVTPLFADDDLVCVSTADALGGYLLFHAPEVEAPWLKLSVRLRS
jgi:hypothetical protein